jgi:Xaa-Pro aminopeptidase
MLRAANVVILPYQMALPKLKDMVSSSPQRKVFTDPRSVNYALFSAIPENQRYEGESPIIGLKATKNDAELTGMRACHIRDGAAMAEFLAWLDETYTTTAPPIDEYDIDIILTEKRKTMSPPGSFVDRSFPTIAGVDSNGAIIHYRASKESCKTLTSNSLLLLDSGAQYLDGTTDVTRTFHMGQPSAYQIEMFTRVLKGHIGIDRSVFPAGTPGCLLDSYAREHLWRVGKDFIHGVGHGVGAALNVHEGPQKISRLLDGHALLPGMIVSNEPGYYEDGNFGIRIENLLVVVEKSDLPEFGGRKFYCFERLTHIPIQKKLMDKALMSKEEIDWVNSYHAEVREKVMPLLETERAKKWLAEATSAL